MRACVHACVSACVCVCVCVCVIKLELCRENIDQFTGTQRNFLWCIVQNILIPKNLLDCGRYIQMMQTFFFPCNAMVSSTIISVNISVSGLSGLGLS